jgi:transposase
VERERELARRPHGSATTTPSIREAIQASSEKNTVLATRYGVNRKTVAKWKRRSFSSDLQMRPKNPRSLSLKNEVIIVAYRWRTRLSLDESHVRLRRLMPQLSRSALYRCLERYGLSKIVRTNVTPPLTSVSLAGPFFFEITADDVDLGGLGVPVLLAVEQVTKLAYGELVEATPENAVAFLARLVAEFPQKIDAVTTEISSAFVHVREAFGEYMALPVRLGLLF